MRLLPSILFGIFLSAKLMAGDEDMPLPRFQIRLEREVFTLDKLTARDILNCGKDDSAKRQTILDLVKSQTASLDQFMILQTSDSQSGKLEQLNQLPVPEVVNSVPLRQQTEHPTEIRRPEISYDNFDYTPNEFATLNFGESFEFNCSLGHEFSTIDFSVQFQSSRLLTLDTTKTQGGAATESEKKYTTSATLRPGIPQLCGSYPSHPCHVKDQAESKEPEKLSLEFITAFISKLPISSEWLRKQQSLAFSPSPKLNLRRRIFTFLDTLPRAYESNHSLRWELFSLPRLTAHTLLHDGLSDSATRDQLLRLMREKTARLESFCIISMQAGSHQKNEDTVHFPYPTDFEPPHVLDDITLSFHNPDLLKRYYKAIGYTPPSHQVKPVSPRLKTSTAPTSFDAVNLGEEIEIELHKSEEARFFQMGLTASYRRLLGKVEYNKCSQPVLELSSMQNSFCILRNTPTLVGTMTRAVNTGVPGGNVDDRIWLAFATLVKR